MLSRTLLPVLILLTAFLLGKCQDDHTVQYYIDLFENFTQNASEWQNPVDSRGFFQASNRVPIKWGHYDFIIIGAGAAGSVLTNRLTDSGRFKVLLLEAGGQESEFGEIPAFAPYLVLSDLNWGYKTIPQTNACLGLKNQQCNYPRGKALGGSTAINFMIYVRGNKEDFDKWGETNPGWDYESVLPYFKKSEKSTVEIEEYAYHGHHGLLRTENVPYRSEGTNLFLEAMQQRGQHVLDYNGRKQIGCSPFQCTTHNGRRWSGNTAFIKPATGRSNLEILDYSLALKILIKDKKAYGVEFIHNGKKYYATASKEVVLSAGVYNSAQLLMLSGIGPKSHLQEKHIPVVQDLPVGQHVHDHQIFPMLFFTTNMTNASQPLTELFEEFIDGAGFLTAPAGFTGVAFASPRIRSSNPSVEYAFFDGQPGDLSVFYEDFIEMTDENWNAFANPKMGKHIWGIIPILLHPKSTGSVKLKTNDPLDFPVIDSNLYSDLHGDDMKEMLSIIKDIFEISKTPAFKSVDSQFVVDPFPGCTDFTEGTEGYWRCLLKQFTYPILHAVASCKMGPKFDRNSVVSSQLKVHGIQSLRVVDASVFPFSIAAHPAPTTFMIGEKGADFIRREYGDL